jgi:Fe-S cluster assembly iron-binding protein IscA
MLSVTSSAKKKLKENLKYENTEDDTLIRITSSSIVPSRVGFILDKEKQGDKIIKDEKGEKLLLIDPEMEKVVSGMVLDYKQLGNAGMQFTIREKSN